MGDPKRDPAKVKCFACGQRGHYANKCPEKDAKEVNAEAEPDLKRTFATWDDTSTFVTYQVFDAKMRALCQQMSRERC